jgi:hypothetical protein
MTQLYHPSVDGRIWDMIQLFHLMRYRGDDSNVISSQIHSSEQKLTRDGGGWAPPSLSDLGWWGCGLPTVTGKRDRPYPEEHSFKRVPARIYPASSARVVPREGVTAALARVAPFPVHAHHQQPAETVYTGRRRGNCRTNVARNLAHKCITH